MQVASLNLTSRHQPRSVKLQVSFVDLQERHTFEITVLTNLVLLNDKLSQNLHCQERQGKKDVLLSQRAKTKYEQSDA